MRAKTCCWMMVAVLCVCLSPPRANGQTGGIGISKGQADAIVAGIVAVAAVIGGVVVFVIYHTHQSQSLRGCVVSNPTGLELQDEGDQRAFELVGMTADLRPGDRVRLKGKHKKAAKGSTGNPTFLVDKLAKDYGACTGVAAKSQ